MTIQLAPRPKNEERRIVAVKRAGLIDNNQDDNFSIFCDLGRELTGFDYAAFSLFDENFQCKISATDGTANDKSERDEFNVCSYVLLSAEPTLVHDYQNIQNGKLIQKYFLEKRSIWATQVSLS